MPSERTQPQNLEAEQSLLGCILIEKDAILKVSDLITPADFYRPAHADIYRSILELWNLREPIDNLSLSNRLKEIGRLEDIGGRAYLMELTTVISTAANIVGYANIIKKKSTRRKLIAAAAEITDIAFEEGEEADNVLNQAERAIMNVSQEYTRTNFVPMSESLGEAFERIGKLHEDKGQLRGVPTGFADLDNLLGGLQKSDLIILAARPSVGKTSFALDIARQAASKHKIRVGLFSLEMSKDQLVDRMISAQSGVNLWNMRRGILSERGPDDNDFEKISGALGTLSEAPVYIDDTPSLNIMQVRAKARRLQMDEGLDLVVIDYLQLMEGRGNKRDENRVQEISEISRALKGLARELDVPVLALSQLSRNVEQSKPAIPKLSHLRDSGSIEQDADIVMFIYRKTADKNYRPEDIPLEEKFLAEIHIAKHRNGPTGMAKLYFDETRSSFRNLEKRFASPVAPPPTQNNKEPIHSN